MAGLVTRFAPSPTGPLHLGHAYSAWTAFDFAQRHNGRFLLRIEDIDTARSKPHFEAQIYDDLQWLGLSWEKPVLRQSDRRAAYETALEHLQALGVTYRCTCRRADIRAALNAPQEGEPVVGPDGLVYPGTCRHVGHQHQDAAIRLDMAQALSKIEAIAFEDIGAVRGGRHNFSKDWLIRNVGDVVLARRDIGVSYHLAVCVDDAFQNVTHVIRGADLFDATVIHRVLQQLLSLPEPLYLHHGLVRDPAGKRLAKRDNARAIERYRHDGLTAANVRDLAAEGL